MSKSKSVDGVKLPHNHHKKRAFAIEYSKDFDHRRAAVAVGYHISRGSELITEPYIIDIIETLRAQRERESHIDAEWWLWECVDNHTIARQQGNIASSNSALQMIGKSAAIDAFAADKLEVATGADIVERLKRGRVRMNNQHGVAALPSESENRGAGGHDLPVNPQTVAQKIPNFHNGINFDKKIVKDKNEEIVETFAKNKVDFF